MSNAREPGVEVVEFLTSGASYSGLRKGVKRVLDLTPSKYLTGLRQVVLREASTMTGEEKRKKRRLSPRGGKIGAQQVLGIYRAEMRGRSASIELFLDKMSEQWPQSILAIPPFADLVVTRTLYHELGHHIHQRMRPEFREREVVAEEWQKRLSREYFRRRYFYLRPFGGLLRLMGRTLRQLSRLRRTLRERRNGTT